MKKWTVMLIPHDRGQTRNLNLASYQLWFVVVLIVALAFASSFLYRRHQIAAAQAEQLRQLVRELERRPSAPKESSTIAVAHAPEPEALDRLRSEYEASVAAITAELTELYEIEAQAREMTGLAPRTPVAAQKSSDIGEGKGGPPGGLEEVAHETQDEMARPASVLYGLSRPSADLIVQEINLRTASLQQLVADLHVERDRIERIPSIWPTARPDRRISSRFGYRKDPFTRRVRHHDGTDITAAYGSPVIATAKGVVSFAGREAYYGNLVKIDHGNGIETWYAHLRKCGVQEGDEVNRGDEVGTLGNTGRTTGAHIHYEVRVDGKPVDSGKYLRE